MVRKIIAFDLDKCDGCGICAGACHEGAIGIVHGKARLLRDDYCDGMGDCLPACPVGAISFEERDALGYDVDAVRTARAIRAASATRTERTAGTVSTAPTVQTVPTVPTVRTAGGEIRNFPVQLKLAHSLNSVFAGEILIAADCSAFVSPEVYRDCSRGRAVLIGCPKLDGVDYSVKLSEIIGGNDVSSVTLLRMSVPCCGGLERMLTEAVDKSGKRPDVNVIVVEV
ncbi:MAG: 4Fe-4S binding protein [Oscillospiraceae bacterium]|jgi:NAD-dependent dihydropyrimidine dehydrogenase PreA subunit|nr:4Fe-4S binding protein [Oscillospiraceae bacterium]